jgi:bifunctional DNA-binding transcriptional regulator/antitoxin component of YhaV-PrlF toxin-antitoxin module
MSNVSMTKDRAITLPLEVCEKHGFNPETPIRIIETGAGVLLVPLTNAPMTDELAQELAEWQALATSGWEMLSSSGNKDEVIQ